ncbi:MAG: tetratricopeptide repeat protein [Spirochaetota bacterium]
MQIQSDPKYQEAMAFYLSGEWTEAEKAFLELRKSYPDSAFAHLILGNIYYSLGKLDTSVEEYQKAVEIHPEFGIALYKLGVCQYRMGKLTEALESFQQVIDSGSESHAMAAYFVGLIHFFLGNDESAAVAFERFRELSPESMIANYYLAQLRIKRKEYDSARKLLKELAAETPNFAEVHYMMGVASFGLHDTTGAMTSLRKALEINPDDERARSKLTLISDVQWP